MSFGESLGQSLTLLAMTFSATIFLALPPAMAAEQTQLLEGVGLDGAPCAVAIVRDGPALKQVTLSGAAEEFEIMAESAGYGPSTTVVANGGAEVFSLVNEDPQLYAKFEHRTSFFSESESFTLDTSDFITDSEVGLLKMVLTLKLGYADGRLAEVKATSKAKAAIVSLATRTFTCSLR